MAGGRGFPSSLRIAIWLIGAVFIFIGLAILSMGTRARLEDEALFANGNDRPNDSGRDANMPPPKVHE